MKKLFDLILILTWFYIIGNGIIYNGWLIVLSIIFWYGDDVVDSVNKDIVEKSNIKKKNEILESYKKNETK